MGAFAVGERRGATARALSGEPRLPQAGELLAIEYLDRSGLVVTGEGAFVRIFRVTPPNPLLMSGEEQQRSAATLQRLVRQLGAGDTLQVYVDARRVNLSELLADCQREVQASAGPPPDGQQTARDPVALSQWRLYAALEESLRLHAEAQAAVQVSHYVVVPFSPRDRDARAAMKWVRGRRQLPGGRLTRPLAAHRRAAREHLARVDALRGELEAEGMATELLDGERVLRLLWARFNPTKANRDPAPGADAVEVLGEFDAHRDAAAAREAAQRLRAHLARSSLDFRGSHHHATVDQDVEQAIVLANTAGRTATGWLHRAMLTRQPYSLCVYVHALERRRERQKLKLAYRRLFTINRGSEQRGRVPDFDRYVQEGEYRQLLSDMATGEQAGLYRVAVYQSVRTPGPQPSLAAHGEAVDWCAEAIESAGDCRVDRGEFRQHELWPSTLPLGRDLAARTRKYPTVNAADMLPLVGTQCGSPSGVPFAFADPGRTVELLNPYDPEHPNYTLLIAGRSGSGKTMTANVILSRCLALGARGFVIDRAGHYETLTRLVEGAQQIEIGAEDSPYAINPWDVPDPARVGREKTAFLLALHQVMMGALDGQQTALLANAIRAVYAKAAALHERPREALLAGELRAQAGEAQRDGAVEVAASLRNLADRLSEYCEQGAYAHLLDRETTVPGDARLVVFDTRRCPDSELRLVMFAVMEYLTSTVQKHWDAHKHSAGESGAGLFGGRSIMLIDEAWHLISRPETGAYANNLARRARHLGLTLIPMSQQLSDFDTEHGVALLGNSSQQLLLAQNPKEIPFIADTLQLSDREAIELGRLKTVKGRHAQMLWLNGSRGRGKVSLRVGPSEYWAFTSDPAEAAIRDREVQRANGNVWAAINALASRGTRDSDRHSAPAETAGEA